MNRPIASLILLLGLGCPGAIVVAVQPHPVATQAVEPQRVDPQHVDSQHVDPQPGDDQAVAAVIDRLSNADPAVRETAIDALYDLPPTAFPLVQEAAKRTDLPPDATQDLRKVVDVQASQVAARDRIWLREHEFQNFNQTTALDAYRSAGKHDPAWDKSAEEAILAFTSSGRDPLRVTAPTKLHNAIAAGCDDPFIVYLNAVEMLKAGHQVQAFAQLQNAADGFHDSKYPAFRKLECDIRLLRVGHSRSLNRFKPAMKPYLAAALDEFALTCAEPKILPSLIYDWVDDLNATLMESGLTRKDAFDKIERILQQAMPNSAVPLVVEGDFYVNYAWDARGSGWATTVTDDGAKKMQDRLAHAADALNKAWTLDPTDARSCELMLQVELGQGQGRQVMENWFSQAMQANPDDYSACEKKVYYLTPKWYGSVQDMLAFARECVDSRRWGGRLPLILAQAHKQLMSDSQNQQVYCQQPEVWQDLNNVYPRYLRLYPNDAGIRNAYASWAWRCGKFEVLNEQLKALGDAADPSQFGGRGNFGKLKRSLADRFPATAPSTQP